MVRFIFKEVYTGHVVYAQGQATTEIKTMEFDLPEIENYLKMKDQKKPSEYLTRELVGIEILE